MMMKHPLIVDEPFSKTLLRCVCVCARACVFAFINSRCAKVRAAVEEANSEVFSVLVEAAATPRLQFFLCNPKYFLIFKRKKKRGGTSFFSFDVHIKIKTSS